MLKNGRILDRVRYDAPDCSPAVFPDTVICADSVSGDTEQFQQGGTYEW